MLQVIFIIIIGHIPLSSGADQPTQILETLRATNDLRARSAQELNQWESDRELLKLQIETNQKQLGQLEKLKKALQAKLKTITTKNNIALDTDVEALNTLEKKLATAIQKNLLALQNSTLPGALAPPQKLDQLQGSFASAYQALHEAENRSEEVRIELTSGHLHGQRISVHLLRLGGVAGWWQSLDGKEQGTATMENGHLQLRDNVTPEDQSAIEKAIHIAQGRLAPVLVTLPWPNQAQPVPPQEEKKP